MPSIYATYGVGADGWQADFCFTVEGGKEWIDSMYSFTNFKGFARADLKLDPPLTILIGPNGSGKSNLIEGIELLAFLAKGKELHEISDIGHGGNLEIRGGLQFCSRMGHVDFQLGFTLESNSNNPFPVYFPTDEKVVKYSILVQTKNGQKVLEEELHQGQTMIFESPYTTKQDSYANTIKIRLNNFKAGNKPQPSVSANMSVLSQYKMFSDEVTNYEKKKQCESLIDDLRGKLYALFVFDPIPKLMRGLVQTEASYKLFRNGANISAILYKLSLGDEKEKKALERILTRIRQLPDEPFGKIDFITTRLGNVQFAFRSSSEPENEDNLIDACLLSDGTLRALAILTALETVPGSSLIIIEEFDNGLHPSRIKNIIEAIQEAYKRRGLRALVTTHNPATLNSLSSEQLDGVILCVPDVEQKASRLLPLKDVPLSHDLLERGRLGDLVTDRVVEKYLAPDFEVKHKEKFRNWLRSFDEQ